MDNELLKRLKEFSERPASSVVIKYETNTGDIAFAGYYLVGYTIAVRRHNEEYTVYLRAEPHPDAKADAQQLIDMLDSLQNRTAFTFSEPSILRKYGGNFIK